MAITIRNVYDTMSDIALHIQNQGTSFCCPYIQQREIIKSTFANGVPYSESCIIRRLIVIDSLYSTNANFNYFSIEEMAAAIYSIGPNEQDAIMLVVSGETGGTGTGGDDDGSGEALSRKHWSYNNNIWENEW